MRVVRIRDDGEELLFRNDSLELGDFRVIKEKRNYGELAGEVITIRDLGSKFDPDRIAFEGQSALFPFVISREDNEEQVVYMNPVQAFKLVIGELLEALNEDTKVRLE